MPAEANAQVYPIASTVKLPKNEPNACPIDYRKTKKLEIYMFVFSLS